MRGGKRPGAGRKPGSVTAAKARMQQTAKDVAAQVLSEVDAVAVWKKLILQQEKPQVVASVMEYLTDRVRPSHTDHPRQSGTTRHDSIAVVLDAGMANIGDGESAGESHHRVNGSRRGDPATHRRASAPVEIERRSLTRIRSAFGDT
jgi:hypothetical protein